MEQKTVIITGGNRGIGLSITQAFVDAGYFVVIGARQKMDIENQFGDHVHFISIDVRKETDHKRLTDFAISKTGTLDCYINNAGFSEWRPIEDIDDSFLNELIGTNLFGVFWGCKAASHVMKSGGSIINISSIAGKRGSSNNSAYCASKFGVNGITQALAKEIGPRNIRVNALCPVLIPTEGLMLALESPFAPAKSDPESFIRKFALENAALKRLPSADEVASMCLFLASEKASAITGQCINIDCGVFPQ